jgi:hypothetical protein
MCLCFPRQILRGWGGHNTQMNHSRTFHVPVFYYIDPSGVGWALPPITSRFKGMFPWENVAGLTWYNPKKWRSFFGNIWQPRRRYYCTSAAAGNNKNVYLLGSHYIYTY